MAKQFEKPAAEKVSGKVECAVLHDSVYGKHDDIILLDRHEAEAAAKANCVDLHPAALKAIRERKG